MLREENQNLRNQNRLLKDELRCRVSLEKFNFLQEEFLQMADRAGDTAEQLGKPRAEICGPEEKLNITNDSLERLREIQLSFERSYPVTQFVHSNTEVSPPPTRSSKLLPKQLPRPSSSLKSSARTKPRPTPRNRASENDHKSSEHSSARGNRYQISKMPRLTPNKSQSPPNIYRSNSWRSTLGIRMRRRHSVQNKLIKI